MQGSIKDIVVEENGAVLRLRCRSTAVTSTSLFFVDRKTVHIARIRNRYFRRGFKVKKFRYSFDEISYLGLKTLVLEDQPGWMIALGLADGSVRDLSFHQQHTTTMMRPLDGYA